MILLQDGSNKHSLVLFELEDVDIVSQLDPYKVLKHHANGDITYEKELHVTDKVNIRRFYPYYQKKIVKNKLNNIQTE